MVKKSKKEDPMGDKSKGMKEPIQGSQMPTGEIKEEAVESEMPTSSMEPTESTMPTPTPGMGESKSATGGEMSAGSMEEPAASAGEMTEGGMGEPAATSEQMPKGGMGEPAATPAEMPVGGMVEATPGGEIHSGSIEGEPLGVLVELNIPVNQAASFALQVATGFEVSGFKLDESYDPVEINPTPDLEAKLAAAGEQTIIIRGTIEESKIPQLEAQANVVKVWRDTRIEPFVEMLTQEEKTDFVMPMEGFGTCPIGTCDCSPGIAKGTITDVAKYLRVHKIWASGFRGDGIVVGVVDGGITAQGRKISLSDTSHPQWPGKLIPRVIGGWPTKNWGTTGVAWGWHGNMCSTDVLGMAPKAQIYDIRISAGGLAATISAAISGFQWAIKQHSLNGTPHILTNSWGIFQEAWDKVYARNPKHPFTRKVVEALDKGILVLFAAGNCGGTCPDGRCGSDSGPGKSIWGANSHKRVMTVGAVNKNEQFVGYSSQGPGALDPKKPDFCSVTHFKGFFPSDSGTSAATPIAAGVVALLKQANPALSQNQTKNALKQTAKDIGPPGWDQHSGAGIIRPEAAFRAVRKQANGRLEVFVRGSNKALWHKWQVAPNNGWSGWASMGGWIDQLAVGRNADGRLEVFVRGANGSLWHKWQVAPNNGWSGWASMGGWIDRLAVGQNEDGRLEVFVRGSNKALWHKWQVAPNDGWSGWASMGGWIDLLAAGRNADGRLEVFVRGGNNALWHKWQVAPNNGWSGWASMGGWIDRLAVGQNEDGRLEVFVRGSNKALWHKWQVAPNNGWSGWASMGGWVDSPVVAQNADGRLEVFVIGLDHALWHKWQVAPNNGWSGWASMGGWIDRLAVSQNADGRLEVFARGSNKALWHKWQVAPNDGWSGWASMGGWIDMIAVGQNIL